jgi:hypothetical protein
VEGKREAEGKHEVGEGALCERSQQGRARGTASGARWKGGERACGRRDTSEQRKVERQ